MYSSSQNRNKIKPASQSIKKQRPRPEWTTDFVDRQQFKLSQTQMIQKKAALQSKHRQDAKRQLQQRRKKLQMGVIDDQTRKVYETALTSKNIDINPSIRKNLTQMIRYEKQQKQKRILNQQDQDQQFDDQQDEYDQYEREIKEAQNFIKKFERAKKQQKIQRAVEILSNKPQVVEKEKRSGQSSQSETRINNFMNNTSSQNSRNDKSLKKQKMLQQSQSFSQDDALSSIQDTIKFMQQKLFAAKKTVEEHSKSFISEQNSVNQSRFYDKKRNQFSDDDEIPIVKNQTTFKKVNKKQQDKKDEINFTTKQNFLQNENQQEQLEFNSRIAEISQLRIKLKDDQNASSDDDECLDTIRRMRQLMDNKDQQNDNERNYSQRLKQNIRYNNISEVPQMESVLQWNNSVINKKANPSVLLQSEAEVSFSLTNNNDDEYQQESSLLNLSKSKLKGNNYENIEVNKQKVSYVKQEKAKVFKPAADFTKKQSKQDEYEDEYQKIKQNLFNCINNSSENNDSDSGIKLPPYKQPFSNKPQQKMFKKFSQDSDQQSQDSLMVRDKINLWKNELQRQPEPQQDQDEEVEQLSNRGTNFKTTYMNTKPQFTRTEVISKQSEYDDDCDEEDDDSTYKYNYFQSKNPPISSMNQQQFNKFQSNEQTNSEFAHTNFSNTANMIMKKPPIAKKPQNTEKFQEMKKMLSNTTSEIQKIQIKPLKIEPLSGNGQMLGFDFRGSINIKKNVLSK